MKKLKRKIDIEFFIEAGKRGGLTTAKRGKDFYKEIGAKGGKTRWAKKKAPVTETDELLIGLEKAGMV